MLGLFVLIFSICKAQSIDKTNGAGYHQHKGFYLSMSIGPNFEGIIDKVVGSYSSMGAQFDLKIGGAIIENIILHATLTSNAMSSPKIGSGGVSHDSFNNISLSEAMIGGGITYYVMPSNIFLSGSMGLGNFTLLNNNDKKNFVSSDKGLSMQLKIGKEWWVSKAWGLGIAFTFGKTKLTSKMSRNTVELMDSSNFGILFSASLH